MEIIKKQKSSCHFADLDPGEVFVHCEDYYIAIYSIIDRQMVA